MPAKNSNLDDFLVGSKHFLRRVSGIKSSEMQRSSAPLTYILFRKTSSSNQFCGCAFLRVVKGSHLSKNIRRSQSREVTPKLVRTQTSKANDFLMFVREHVSQIIPNLIVFFSSKLDGSPVLFSMLYEKYFVVTVPLIC